MPEAKPEAKPKTEKPEVTDLALRPDTLPVASNLDALKAGAKGVFSARIQLMTPNTKQIKTDGRGELLNHYAIVDGDDIIDLGKEVDVFVFAGRMKAMEMGEVTLVVYDPEDPEFKRIDAAASAKGSSNIIRYCGPEYLIYVPQCTMFSTFYMGGKTSRRESSIVTAILEKWQKGIIPLPTMTMKSKKIPNKTYGDYQSPYVTICSSPLTPPSREELTLEMEKFNNPPKSEVESVDTSVESRER